MKYIYHYHAQTHEASKVTSIDGIITAKSIVDSMDRYAELKCVIIKDLYLQANRLVITSLSLLHELDE